MPREISKGTASLSLVAATATLGDAISAVRRYKGTYAACLAGALPKGAWGTGDLAGYRVASSTPSHNGDTQEADLTINWEWAQSSGIPPQGADLPPDVDSCRKEQIDIKLDRTARFAPLRDLEVIHPLSGQTVNIVGLIEMALVNTKDNESYFKVCADQLGSTNGPLAIELRKLMQRETTHKRIWVPVYSSRSYHWILPFLDGGGYCVPRPFGPNAWALPAGFDWLRVQDEFSWTGAHYEVSREWIGISNTTDDGSNGGWERAIYPHP